MQLPKIAEILTPDGPITRDQLANTTLDDMWEAWPTLAYWLWDNDQMVASKPEKPNYNVCLAGWYGWED